jgi:MerR family transcriptional regulator, copper efflux regulator
MQPLRIGRLARLANVNVQTLRFYEREGLLSKPYCRLSGYREYPAEAVGLVILIKRIQVLGFTLKDIKAIMAFRQSPSTTLGDVASRLESKIGEIDAKIGELQKLRNNLRKIVKSHRQGSARPFAPLFEDYVQQLSGEAIAEDNEKMKDRKRKKVKKIAKGT